MRRGHGPGHAAHKRPTAATGGAARDSGFYESADKAGLSIIYYLIPIFATTFLTESANFTQLHNLNLQPTDLVV